MDNPQKQRLKRLLQLAVWAAGFGLLLLISSIFLHRGIPCPLFQLTGIRCPACGMTRGMVLFLSGDFYGALRQNLLFPFLFGLLILLCTTQSIRYYRSGRCGLKSWDFGIYTASAVILILWMAVRNYFHL